jgi:nucleoside-diphosphate-sugar epimerase
MERREKEEASEFGRSIAEMEPEVVIDLICFNKKSGEEMVKALRGRVHHYLSCGTIWVHGHSEAVPTKESAPRRPFGEYGIQKAELEEYLLVESRTGGFPATTIHPGHIVGEGWPPLNPEGHFDTEVWKRIAGGKPVLLPNLGLETVHHVHADDVARLFLAAMERWAVAIGESFHAVSPQALTLRGYAEAAFRWFGREPNLSYAPWEELKSRVSEANAGYIRDHIAHSPCCSIRKARDLLGWEPRYSSLEAVHQSVRRLEANGRV